MMLKFYWNLGKSNDKLRILENNNKDLVAARLFLIKKIFFVIKSGLNILNVSDEEELFDIKSFKLEKNKTDFVARRKTCKDFDSFCRHIDYQLKLPIEDRKSVPKYVFSTIVKEVIGSCMIPSNDTNKE